MLLVPEGFDMAHRVSARIATMFCLAACLTLPVPGPASVMASTPRKPAPEFTLTDATGSSVKLSDYKGRVVLLNFWATWCHGCQEEIPWFVQFEEKYKGGGLAVIGVSMDDDGWKSVKPFLEQKKLNYTIVVGNEPMGKLFGLDTMPMTLLIDREGQIAASYSGVVDREKCEAEIRSLLRDSSKSQAK
jgi:peroxiredoxin